LIREVKPGAIYHCAAATDAAYCEQHPDEARADIVDATGNLTRAVAELALDTPFVALSTDLVFDGEHAPYREVDLAQPVCEYGRLKLEAERSVLELPRGVALRSSLVYGPPSTHKASFLGWMVDALAGGRPLELFSDEVRTPIFVDDLCDAMVALAHEQGGASGLWHAGGPQRLDRATVGRVVSRALGLDDALVRPVLLAESSYAAPRPRDVSLDSDRLWSRLSRRPRTLAEGLQAVVDAGGLRPGP
jgi:dTDP-4-dehydrorhamnose reductase